MSDEKLRELESRWAVWRVDDNGNRFLVSQHASEQEAQEAASTYEARAHKQHYWVEPVEAA